MARGSLSTLNIRRRNAIGVMLILALSSFVNGEEATSPDATALTFEQKLAACAACHGPSGNAPTAPIYPRLAGQHASYLEHALRSYRAGRRKDPIMQQQVQALDLSETDIVRLANYFARQAGLQQIAGRDP